MQKFSEISEISDKSLEVLKAGLFLLANDDYKGFMGEMSKVENFSKMVRKDKILGSPKIGNFLKSSMQKEKIYINVFSVIISAMINSGEKNSKRMLDFFKKSPEFMSSKKVIDPIDPLDPLAPAFIVQGKKSSVVKTNFEMMMSINNLPLDIFLKNAKSAGRLDDRKNEYRRILDDVIKSQTGRLVKHEQDNSGRRIIWKNILICAFNDIHPSDFLMDQTIGVTEGKNNDGTKIKFSFPWDVTFIFSPNDGLSSPAMYGEVPRVEVGLSILGFAATTNGSDILVSHFLKKGHDVNQSNPENLITALHVAAARGDKKCAHYLVAAGANMDATDSRGRTPLQYLEQIYKDSEADKKMMLIQEFKAIFDARKAMDAIDSMMGNLTISKKDIFCNVS